MSQTYFIKHKKYLDQIQEDIADAEKVISKSGDINFKSFDLHDELCKAIWDSDSKIKENIRKKLLQIAHDFYDTLDIAEIVTGEEQDEDTTFDKYIKDVLFVGSLASYNYSSYADVDLHLLMDENKLTDGNELALNILKKYFTECKNDWNLKHTDLKVKGYDCELYVQDVTEKNASNGCYSLTKNKWLIYPKELDTTNFDREWTAKKAIDYIDQIDELEKIITSNSDSDEVAKAKERLKTIKDKIVQGRRDSLAAGQGEMNKYNILFKILRRSGHIEKINNLTVSAYDSLNSIKEKDFKEGKRNMNTDEYVVKENSEADEISDFVKMYGEEAGEALEKYMAKRPGKSAIDILTTDDEFEKFSNWAYKHLGIDVYANFSKYDVGDFYKRTSSLAANPEGTDNEDDIDFDGTEYSVVDQGDTDYDDFTEFEESICEENGELNLAKAVIRGVFDGDFSVDSKGRETDFEGKLVNSEDLPTAVNTIYKAYMKYGDNKDREALKNTIVRTLINYGNDVPADIEEEFVYRMMNMLAPDPSSYAETDPQYDDEAYYRKIGFDEYNRRTHQNIKDPFAKESITEDNGSLDTKIRRILTGDFEYDEGLLDGSFDDEFSGKLVNSSDMNFAIRKIKSAAYKLRSGKSSDEDFKGAVESVFAYCGNDMPIGVEDAAVNALLNAANDLALESKQKVSEADGNTFKKKLIIGAEKDNETIFIIRDDPYVPSDEDLDADELRAKKRDLDPNEEANKVLKAFGIDDWTANDEYNYWYFIVNKNINDEELKNKVKPFETTMDVEWNTKLPEESKVKEADENSTPAEKPFIAVASQDGNSDVWLVINDEPTEDMNSLLEPIGANKWEKATLGGSKQVWVAMTPKSVSELRTIVKPFEEKFKFVWPSVGESESAPKVIGKTWDEFVKNIEAQTDYAVDSAFKSQPNANIDLLKKSDNSKFSGEVISYSDGSYELMIHNIKPLEEVKQQTLNEKV